MARKKTPAINNTSKVKGTRRKVEKSTKSSKPPAKRTRKQSARETTSQSSAAKTPHSGRAKAARSVDGEEKLRARRKSFPVVGIGASAGGLEAFTELLKHLPVDTGLAFVLVQHLDPVHESALANILSKATSMPVQEVTNNLPVQADHVYVIPPNTTLSMVQRVLKLEPRGKNQKVSRSIDAFFESLAEDQRERSIGVILSGTASDGTIGLEAIKAEGGITFAQDNSAKYESMPQSAVAAGCVDFVLSPADIANEIARIARHPYVAGKSEEISRGEKDRASATEHEDDESALPSGGHGTPGTGVKRVREEAEAAPTNAAENGFKKILVLLRNHCGVDFSLYKSSTIQRRITRRMVLNRQNTLEDYAGFLRGNAKELDALYSDALISVTSFFRNTEAFDVLKHRVFPKLHKQRGDDSFRVWVVGCSTGQEAYSIAMAFIESADKAPRLRKVQVFATDLNDALLDKARNGLYAKSLVEDVSPERLRRFFVEEEGGYRIVKSLREMVVFARQNLISDPPFSRMDLISCRNLLIYLEQSLQRKALPTFHYALKPGGFLFLGASESIGVFAELFEPIDKKQKIYAKKVSTTSLHHLPVSRQDFERKPAEQARRAQLLLTKIPDDAPQVLRGELNAQREADRVSVNQFAPPGVLVNSELEILQFRGPTTRYLQPPSGGKATFNVLKMAREGLMLPLRAAINRAKKENKPASRDNVRIDQDGSSRLVNIQVIPLKNLRERCFLILFKDKDGATIPRGGVVAKDSQATTGSAPSKSKKAETRRLVEVERDFAETREYLEAVQEQYEAANEELQASYEEVQSANEELQSINEELETSKEELESTNEELTTVNEEMAHRNAELGRLNSDLLNLQTSTKLAILLLGRDLTIRRFSPQAEKRFNLLPSDVGRPIGNIRHNLNLPDLEELVEQVINTLRENEREVQDKTGCWYALRVRPYISIDNKVDGAVLVLHDIDVLKRTEVEIREKREYAEAIINTTRDPLLILNADLRVYRANDAFYQTFKVSREESEGRLVYELGNGQWQIPKLRELLEEILPRNNLFNAFEVSHEFETIGSRTMLLNARRLDDISGQPARILIGIEDVTDLMKVQSEAQQLKTRYEALIQASAQIVWTTDASGAVVADSFSWRDFTGQTFELSLGFGWLDALHPDDRDRVRKQWQRAVKDRTPVETEYRVRNKNNEFRWMAVRAVPVLNHDNSVREWVGMNLDITERKQAETEREDLLAREKQARREADEASRLKDEFLATVSHELRAPLNAIMGWSHMVNRGNLDQETLARANATIERNAKAQSQLISDLLDVSRIIAGQFNLESRIVDLVSVIEAATDTVRPAAEAKRVELRLALDREAGFVSGDATRLQQIIWNLLANAIKFTPESGQIDVRLKRENSHMLVSVSDTGEGISPEFLPYIFDRFRQAKGASTRQHGGLGLGLAIVRHLVDAHGGSVRAASQGLGHGATFTVALPLLPYKAAMIDRETQDVEKRPFDTQRIQVLKDVRILVVDDEADARDLLTIALRQSGGDVKAVGSAREALELLSELTPDLLISDIAMPDEDGYYLISKIRERSPSRSLPALAITGYAGAEDAKRALAAGYDLHMPKPVSPSELVAQVASLVAKSRKP